MESFNYYQMSSPVGPLHLVSDGNALRVVAFDANWPTHRQRVGAQLLEQKDTVLQLAETQLREYFAGQRKQFQLPVNMVGTELQAQVWSTLQTIPFGITRTYGEQARQVSRPKAVRAIGRINGQNPISIVVPCHRVIGASGKLTGYAGGLEIKKRLLRIEGLSTP
jgi:methylated-DNA-[protein]-cysteine S-methyltransferase